MSTLASPFPASTPRSPRRAASVTAHPWFAAIVALWFAALLGLSSIAVAPDMLERIVAASGIGSFIAAAAPPLGQTARLLVALGLAGLGGALGLILGRTLAARAKFTRSGAREVVHAASEEPSGDEADTFGEDEPGLGLRDRLARLTGQGDGPRDFADLPKLRARDRHPDAPGRKPLTPSDDLVADDGVAEHLPASDEPLELDLVNAEAPVSPLYEADPAPIPALAGANLDSLGVVQLTERLAIAMQARRNRDARRRQAVAATPDDAPIVLPSLIAVRPKALAPTPAATPELSAAHDKPELGGKARGSGYSSLLGLGRPAGGDALTAGEPVPAIAGPAGDSSLPAPSRFPAASDPAENYRALQAALDSIQRLSGTR